MNDITNLSAAILVGGLGTRLRSVLPDRPKVLAEVLGRPFLERLLDQLVDWGVSHLVLCTGYLGDLVQSQIGHSYGPLTLTYSQESSPLGTGGALRLALPFFRSDNVLVLNGESYCGADLRPLYAYHVSRDSEATLLLVRCADTKRYGRVQTDDEGHILRFDEKGAGKGPGMINAGVYLVKRYLLQSIPEGEPVSLERDVFPSWIGRNFYGYEGTGPFLDIGTPESYALAEQFFSETTR
jgi:D-glycero-alpha-D-manno-heptose 1-phosphate guanylyltransferase